MFLRRVTITGFKSFAAKTVLNLEPGMTAIVGPNGSGKSNLADAIRWALGEQSKSRLRLQDREEVVFSGTQKTARASYAEVVLVFDNEDGAFPLDLTAVQISRRLYRSGESQYQLAGRNVKLSDIQMLLAQAGIGIGSYAVIGQGTIDSFLSAPPGERKLLFDDAVGIRGPELTRAGAMRRLEQTSANLTRLKDMRSVLTPHLAGLADSEQLDRLRETLSSKVSILRRELLCARLAEETRIGDNARRETETLTALLAETSQEHLRLELVLAQRRQIDSDARDHQSAIQGALQAQEANRDELGTSLAAAQGRLEVLSLSIGARDTIRSRRAALSMDLQRSREKLVELSAEQVTNEAAAERSDAAVAKSAKDVASAQAALVAARPASLESDRDAFVTHALAILRSLATSLKEGTPDPEEIRLLVNKAGRLLVRAQSAESTSASVELVATQKKLEQAMVRRETAIEHQTNIAITLRSLDIDITHIQEEIARGEESFQQLDDETKDVHAALAQRDQVQSECAALAQASKQATARIDELRVSLSQSHAQATNAEELADLAVALERVRSQESAATARLTEAGRVLLQTDANLEDLTRQAAAWHIVPEPLESAVSSQGIGADLARAEAALEAHDLAARDKAEQFEQMDSRERDIAAQIQDLETAHANLTQVIAELDQRIQERFTSNFAQLSTQFGHYFVRLFGGGSAKLELEQSEEGYGVAVKVTPKGRRTTSLSSLSGGERALAGVAMLSAILSTTPSPFVVLDEVDAALDEANSARLSEILGELGSRSQLIVITHNRQTMNAARVLFGITMDSRHVSNLLSMRLEEASRLAAR